MGDQIDVVAFTKLKKKEEKERKLREDKELKEAEEKRKRDEHAAARNKKEELIKQAILKRRLEEFEKKVAEKELKLMAVEDALWLRWHENEKLRKKLIAEYEAMKTQRIKKREQSAEDEKLLKKDGLDYHSGLLESFTIWRPHESLIFSYDCHDQRIYSINISYDSKFFVTGSADRTIRMWNYNTGALIRILQRNEGVAGHRGEVRCACIFKDFVLDEYRIISCSSDKTLKMWNWKNGSVIHNFLGHTDLVYRIVVSLDGQLCASTSADCSVKLWDLYTGKLIFTFHGHVDSTTGISFSTDAKYLVTAGGYNDRSIRIWSVDYALAHSWEHNKAAAQGKDEFLYKREDEEVATEESEDQGPDIQADPFDFYVPFAVRERTKITKEKWKNEKLKYQSNLEIGKNFKEWNSEKQIFQDINFEHDPTLHAGHFVTFIDFSKTNPEENIFPHILDLLETVNSMGVIIEAPSREQISKRIELSKGRLNANNVPLCRFILGGVLCSSAAVKNGFCNIVSHQRQFVEENEIEEGGKKILTEAELILASSEANPLKEELDKIVADIVEELKSKRTKNDNKKKEEDWVALAVPKAKIILLNIVEKRGRLKGLLTFRNYRNSLILNPIENLGLYCLCESHLPNNGGNTSHSNWVNDVQFNFDGKIIASVASDLNINIWDSKTGWLIQTLTGFHSDILMKVDFSPTTNRLLTASLDKTIIIWDYVLNNKLSILHGHLDSVYDARWTPDGHRILSSSYDRTIKVWQIDPVLPDPPMNPNYTNLFTDIHEHYSRVDLDWRKPNSNGAKIINYIIQRQIKGTDQGKILVPEWGDNLVIPPSSLDDILFCRIEPIKPGLSYQFRICSESTLGLGSYGTPSEWIDAHPAKPTKILKPIAYKKRSTEIDIRWPMPDDMGAHITKFRIQYRGGTIKSFSDENCVIVRFVDAEEGGKKAMDEDVQMKNEETERRQTSAIYVSKLAVDKKIEKKRLANMTSEEKKEYKKNLKKIHEYKIREQSTPAMVATVKNLTPGLSYIFRVRAINRIDESDWSEESISAMCLASFPAQPEPPTASKIDIHYINLEFYPPYEQGSPISEMKISYKINDDGNLVDVLKDKLSRSHILNNLEAGVKIFIYLSARNENGWSEMSKAAIFETLRSVPDAPPKPIAIDPRPTSLCVKWKAPNDNGSPILHYIIVKRDGEVGAYEHPVKIDIFNLKKDKDGQYGYVMKELFAGVVYEFKVIAVNSLGGGPLSESSVATCTAKAQPPLAPEIPTCSQVTDTTMTIHWEEPDGRGAKVIGYKVYPTYMETDSNIWKEEEPITVKDLKWTLTKLKPKAIYALKVTAYNIAGEGEHSLPLEVKLLTKAQYISIKAEQDKKEREAKTKSRENNDKLNDIVKNLL